MGNASIDLQLIAICEHIKVVSIFLISKIVIYAPFSKDHIGQAVTAQAHTIHPIIHLILNASSTSKKYILKQIILKLGLRNPILAPNGLIESMKVNAISCSRIFMLN